MWCESNATLQTHAVMNLQWREEIVLLSQKLVGITLREVKETLPGNGITHSQKPIRLFCAFGEPLFTYETNPISDHCCWRPAVGSSSGGLCKSFSGLHFLFCFVVGLLYACRVRDWHPLLCCEPSSRAPMLQSPVFCFLKSSYLLQLEHDTLSFPTSYVYVCVYEFQIDCVTCRSRTKDPGGPVFTPKPVPTSIRFVSQFA